MTVNFSRIWWSTAGDLEDFSSAGAGYLDIYHGLGGLTGLASLGNLFFAFQEKAYTVYQYQVGDTPLNYSNTINHGCNFKRTIVEINNELWYLSDDGEIRRTNGYSDVSVSSSIKQLTNKILNNRSIKNYFDDVPNAVPHAFWDKHNNAYRLFYAGTSSNVDKCLTYFIDKELFSTASSVPYLTSTGVFGFENYLSLMGNSNATGITYYFQPNNSATDKTGTLDLGWLSSGNPKNQVKIYNVELWLHAQTGVTTNCDCTISVDVYTNPATNAIDNTYTGTLTYNSTVDNLQKLRIQTPKAYGDYVRLVISDSGTATNYSINKIIVETDTMEGTR